MDEIIDFIIEKGYGFSVSLDLAAILVTDSLRDYKATLYENIGGEVIALQDFLKCNRST